ncbi:DNA polymerase IV [Acidisphaera sp. L21]|uniref:DNA polymerase IV n=1 Tax=Acidisphaera sp. L21 TaxID=1641851 RepID=UPI00131B3BCF|nr:DNA polymerase IV [Acidisphaera sp. L21]
MRGLCRDCFAETVVAPCPRCGHGRIVRHAELFSLDIAHIDCDAFYASVEKRDRPELAARPVLVGGSTRGVVSAACYIARMYGCRSAMPMFKALKLCPDAVIIRPDFAKYTAASHGIRALMANLSPLVQPLSIDEAVVDMSGTSALHGAPPAVVLARFARDVEATLGLTVSIGLAPNRLLAKLAAGQDKPRGFAVFGTEAAEVMADWPVRALPGVGPALERRLAGHGITHLGHLGALDDRAALARLGDDGPSLARRARGEDARVVNPERDTKSVSAETTFDTDYSTIAELERPLWRLSEKLARRLREKELAAGGVVLKLKTARFALRTRAARLPGPTVLPDLLFAAARGLLVREADGTAFRLIGIGASPLMPGYTADRGDLADPHAARRVAAQAAVDKLRKRFGEAAIGRGRGLPLPRRDG